MLYNIICIVKCQTGNVYRALTLMPRQILYNIICIVKCQTGNVYRALTLMPRLHAERARKRYVIIFRCNHYTLHELTCPEYKTRSTETSVTI